MRITSTSCICPVLVCLCFVQRCYGASHHGSIKVTRNQTKHIEGETEVHHRPKRGWVWNQFFVLEEHMGPDPQYVGKVRSLSYFLFCFSPSSEMWHWKKKTRYFLRWHLLFKKRTPLGLLQTCTVNLPASCLCILSVLIMKKKDK